MNLTLPDTAQTFVSMQSSAETRRAYERDLGKWFGFLAMDGLELDVTAVLRFKELLAEDLSANSAARTFSTVRSYYKFLTVAHGAPASPFEYVKGPKRPTGVTPKVPTDDEVSGVVGEAARDPQRNLIVSLLLNGLRAGEVCALRKSDVEKHDGLGTVLRVNGKGQKQRLVPATVETELAIVRRLRTLRYVAEVSSEWLVSDYDGRPLTVRQVEHAVYKSAEYAGVEGMHPHALRHHYATRLVRAGASPLHVQQLLGHANVSTTMVYVTLDLADLVKAAQLDPRNQPAAPAVLEAVS